MSGWMLAFFHLVSVTDLDHVCTYVVFFGFPLSVPQLRQNFPKNLPLLTVFTTAWALYVGVFSLMFTRGSVVRAVFQAAFVVGAMVTWVQDSWTKRPSERLAAIEIV